MAVIPGRSHKGSEENDAHGDISLSSGYISSPNHHHKSTSRSSIGRTRSTRPFKYSIRSAVPDTSVITLAKRPDQGGIGKKFIL